jgi:hypothetical protein
MFADTSATCLTPNARWWLGMSSELRDRSRHGRIHDTTRLCGKGDGRVVVLGWWDGHFTKMFCKSMEAPNCLLQDFQSYLIKP